MQLWDLLHDNYIVTTIMTERTNSASNKGGGGGGGKEREGIWLERCISGLVGELKEERQLMLRKVLLCSAHHR